jgi:hypothetical protein
MDNIDKNIISKRFQTTMIGALYEFEENFGYLWGQQKYENEPLTEKEAQFGEIWDNVRNKILNNGNNQLRKCISDLEKNQRQSCKYNYSFRNFNNNERK